MLGFTVFNTEGCQSQIVTLTIRVFGKIWIDLVRRSIDNRSEHLNYAMQVEESRCEDVRDTE